jgi:hypothetical protein
VTRSFAIPAYGGAVPEIDTNYDSIPDVPVSCRNDVNYPRPLTGSGQANTTGSYSLARTPMNPREFTLPAVTSSVYAIPTTTASRAASSYYPWEVHYAQLGNEDGLFGKNSGDGSFAVNHTGAAKRKATQSAGKNQFGGVMRLLGSYRVNRGILNSYSTTSVVNENWLLDSIGAGDQYTASGVVTAGRKRITPIVIYTRDSGYLQSPYNYVYAEAFKWTTGSVTVTAVGGTTTSTYLQRNGYDNRSKFGAGNVRS